MSKRTKLDFTKYYHNRYYPKQGTSIKQALRFNKKERRLPLDVIESIEQHYTQDKSDNLVHWFRNDLRVQDNTALFNCIKRAKDSSKKVVGVYVISTRFWRAHLESPWKIALIQHSLKRLSKELEKYNIPLSVIYLDDSDKEVDFSSWFVGMLKERFQCGTVYFNLVYDFDELERDITLVNSEINTHYFHDLCIVKPLTLKTNSTNTQYSKFSPWFKKWVDYIQTHPYKIQSLSIDEDKLDSWDFKQFQRWDTYALPLDLQLTSLEEFGTTSRDIENFQAWMKKVDEHSVRNELKEWLTEDAVRYKTHKDQPIESTATSRLSHSLTIGLISPRQVHSLYLSQRDKSTSKDYKDSIDAFVREVAFRDFYKHVLSNWPYMEFNIPFNFSSMELKWEKDPSKFEKWALGKTGFPIVDASMRQLLHTGYMNNRCRMIVASFLSKDLNQDWRWGQDWFHHHLLDCDFSSNNAGWQWCASVGVDAQPWFRIFNVYTQSEKFDPQGDFIRKWVHELSDVRDKKVIHTGVGVDGYIPPIINRNEAREAALERYREALT